MADIFPGARVAEAGVGSGALSISLLRAVGDSGYLHSFERREEFADIARGNVETTFDGPHPAWQISVGDFQEEVVKAEEPGSVDRVVLDMLAPWECLDAVATVLAPGGVWINYVATVTQLSRTAEAIRADSRFTEPDAWESMVRGWHHEGLAVRPDDRMVAHTGFLLVTRRLAGGVTGISVKRRPSKTEFNEEDVNAWTPGAVGERAGSDKKLRRAAVTPSPERCRRQPRGYELVHFSGVSNHDRHLGSNVVSRRWRDKKWPAVLPAPRAVAPSNR